MPQTECSEEWYHSKDGRCCRRCEAGTYKQKDCDQTTDTQCAECGRGYYMATSNHMDKCRECKKCNPNTNHKKVSECTAQEDTVCACESGFYCSNAGCEHCRPVSLCPPGQGVKTHVSRTNDTVCSPCATGTYSNVSDYNSPCKPHTRCEDIGRELQTPGTAKNDAICGNFKNSCHWMLPAGLWSGLVLTAVIVFGLALFCWRTKRKLYRTGSSSVPDALVVVPEVVDIQLELPLPSKELLAHIQEETYRPAFSSELPPFKSEDTAISYVTQDDSDDSNVPITPLKASVSFTESHQINGSSGYSTANYLRTFSEPQEDEWCGT